MKFIFFNTIKTAITIAVLFSHFAVIAENLTGAGATFPAPIYAKWADLYKKETDNSVNYQSIGSSGGIKQIIANTVDFAATDVPLSDKKLIYENLFQFPTLIGGVVLVVNLPKIKSMELVLDGKVLSDIYLGKLKKWNDKAIIKLNPNLQLPKKSIIVIRRADSSGTSFVFTSYLSKVSEEWKHEIGSYFTINWPIGLGGKGNDGVAALIQRLPGSIGYIEYSYAKENNLVYTKLVSADGELVIPSTESFARAAKVVDWKKSFAQDLTNQRGDNIWPITSTTFILIHKKQKWSKKNIETLKFFDWAYRNGRKQADDLGYANLPKSVIKQIRIAWKINIKNSSDHILYQ